MTKRAKPTTARKPAREKPITRFHQLTPKLKRGEGVVLIASIPKPPKNLVWWPGGTVIITHDNDRTPLGWTAGPASRAEFKTRTYDKHELLKVKYEATEFERLATDIFDVWADQYKQRPAIKWLLQMYLPGRDLVLEYRS